MKKIIILIIILLTLCIKTYANNNQKIYVAYTIDNNYPIFTLLSINSIIKNSDSDYCFYIIENNLTEKNKQKMKDFVEQNHQEIEFVNIDTNEIDKGNNIYNYSFSRITPIGIARIALPDLLPKNIHRVLYIDGDTFITGDISELYNINMGKYHAAMVSNISKPDEGLYKFNNGYFNSGMILIDLDKWRKDNITQQMTDFLIKNLDKFIYKNNTSQLYFLYPDQDLINIVLDGKILKVHKKWNNQAIYNKYITSIENKGIIHFIGPVKPWDFPKDNKEVIDMYFDYWDNSSLYPYKYYYGTIKIKKIYLDICKTKLKRYKDFVQLLRHNNGNSIL